MVKDIKVKSVIDYLGEIVFWNVKIESPEDDKFRGAGWIESRTFNTELEANIAANVCESILKKFDNEFLKDIDFPLSKWKTLTKAIFYMLDTPNKDSDF